jgi:hypothetical protein
MGPSFVNKMYENIKHGKKLFARYKTLELNLVFYHNVPRIFKNYKKNQNLNSKASQKPSRSRPVNQKTCRLVAKNQQK